MKCLRDYFLSFGNTAQLPKIGMKFVHPESFTNESCCGTLK